MIEDQAVRTQVRCAIAQHMYQIGPFDLQELRDQFPAVAEEDFWDELDGVRRRQFSDNPHQWPQALTRPEPKGEAEEAPALPEPSRAPIHARDLGAEMLRLFEDADLLRATSLDAQGRILDRKSFIRSIELRERCIGSALAVREKALAPEMIRHYLAELAAVVAEFAPEVNRQVLARNDALHQILLQETLDNASWTAKVASARR